MLLRAVGTLLLSAALFANYASVAAAPDSSAAARKQPQPLAGISFIADQPKKKESSIVAFADGWSNYGDPYEPATSYHADGLVSVQGLASGNAGLVGTVTAAHQPLAGRLIFSLMKGGEPSRVDILEDGRIFPIVGGGVGAWLSLDGMAFERPSKGVELSGFAERNKFFRPVEHPSAKAI